MQDKTANLPGTQSPHPVAVVVYDRVALMELGVACDIFGGEATTAGGTPLYQLTVCGTEPSVSTDAGFAIQVPRRLDALDTARTVIVPPTDRPGQVPAAVLDALRQARARHCRLLSLCTGAFVLAEAGILDGHTATTHWSECAELARRYPRVSVDPGVLYTDETDLLTSAGSAASLDLCLHVVQRDYGTEIATQVARDLVVPLHREGGQAQYIDTPLPELDSANLFADTVTWLQAHLDQTVTVNDLATRSAMSPRTFARQFLASTGTTPYQWLLRERIRLAQRLLETSDLPIDSVAEKSGLRTASNLRKHFGRTLRTSPHAYRRTFQVTTGQVTAG
ncbi:MAG TPA: helix-turn-helix domain-containing protein [Streptosporangiaceae bacterium]